jgi:hypothetical protein
MLRPYTSVWKEGNVSVTTLGFAARRRTPRGVMLTAVVSASGLFGVAAIHAVWIVSPWPLDTWDRFARVVLGTPDGQVPPGLREATPVMVALMAAAGYLVIARSGLVPVVGPRWAHRIGLWVVAAALLGRATVGGFLPSGLGLVQAAPEYFQADLAIYSPLCLALGTAVAFLARRPLADRAPLG